MIEAYSALTRHGRHMARADSRKYVASFRYWHPLAINIDVIETAWREQDRFGFSWWDCLIVAAARISECNYLLTEDLQHGQDLGGIAVVNPFEAEPGEAS